MVETNSKQAIIRLLGIKSCTHTAPAEDLRRDLHPSPDHDAGPPVAVLERVQNDSRVNVAANSSRSGPTFHRCCAYCRTHSQRLDAGRRTCTLVGRGHRCGPASWASGVATLAAGADSTLDGPPTGLRLALPHRDLVRHAEDAFVSASTFARLLYADLFLL